MRKWVPYSVSAALAVASFAYEQNTKYQEKIELENMGLVVEDVPRYKSEEIKSTILNVVGGAGLAGLVLLGCVDIRKLVLARNNSGIDTVISSSEEDCGSRLGDGATFHPTVRCVDYDDGRFHG